MSLPFFYYLSIPENIDPSDIDICYQTPITSISISNFFFISKQSASLWCGNCGTYILVNFKLRSTVFNFKSFHKKLIHFCKFGFQVFLFKKITIIFSGAKLVGFWTIFLKHLRLFNFSKLTFSKVWKLPICFLLIIF